MHTTHPSLKIVENILKTNQPRPLDPNIVEPRWKVTKTYGHERGLSCAFRQWRSDSHCSFMHGYALAVSLRFVGNSLDERNWLVDFGSFKDLKGDLDIWFDHRTLIASDDPHLVGIQSLAELGVMSLHVFPHVGIEAFSEFIACLTQRWLDAGQMWHIRIAEVQVSEHPANSASWVNR